MNNKLIASFILFNLCLVVHTSAQVSDHELWYNMNVKYRITKKIDILGTANIKADLRDVDINSVYTELGVAYEPIPYLEMQVYYRHITQKPLSSDFTHKYRWYANIEGKLPVNRWQFDLRLRYLQQYLYNWKYTNVKQVPEQYLRMKYNISYNIKNSPLKPFVYAEWHYPVIEGGVYKYRDYRLGLGTDWKLLKNYAVELEYFFEKSVRPQVKKNHIFQITYIIKI